MRGTILGNGMVASGRLAGGSAVDGIEGVLASVEHAVGGEVTQDLFVESAGGCVGGRKVFEGSIGRFQAGVVESGKHAGHVVPGLLAGDSLLGYPGCDVADETEVGRHGRRRGAENVEMVFGLDLEYLAERGEQLGRGPRGWIDGNGTSTPRD